MKKKPRAKKSPKKEKETRQALCPSCGAPYLAGEDRCGRCLHSLMSQDILRLRKGEAIQEAMMTAPIAELLTGKDLLVAATDDTIQKVVRIFQKDKKDCVLVFKKKKLVGIVSQRDILHKVAGKFKDLSKLKVEAVMTRNPEYVRAEDPIAYVVNKMAMGGFRHVPVIADDGTPISIVTVRDVLLCLGRRGPQEKRA